MPDADIQASSSAIVPRRLEPLALADHCSCSEKLTGSANNVPLLLDPLKILEDITPA